MQFIGYLTFLFFSRFISLIPFRLLYLISDALAWLLRSVIKYRLDVIMKNLHHAFPGKEDKELQTWLPNIYRNFTDIILESFKSSFTSTQTIIDRYQFNNPPEFESEENVENGTGLFLCLF